MNYHERNIFAIIGAGPKGIAVAVKAKVLEEFGFKVDRVVLIEKKGVAANWSGEFGYTNGEMKLGTPPEKDVIFPLEIDVGDDALNRRIRERLLHFSWTSFLIHTDRYSDWVDRGRHAPCHKLWALYLQWISEQLEPEVSMVSAEVIQIDLTSDSLRWELTLQECTSKKAQFKFIADRLMLTGPGKIRSDFIKYNENSLLHSVYDIETFWDALKIKAIPTSGKLAIIGAGENAASVLLALTQYAPDLQIDVISPKGFISSRAESYYENQIFSQPEKHNWSMLSISDRLDFIARTDLGVFSLHAMSILNDQKRHRIVAGRVTYLKQDDGFISLTLSYLKKILTYKYDYVILATGFDQIATLKSLLTSTAQHALVKAISAPLSHQLIAFNIQADLSVKNMKPYLHLPMLAGLMQGPGFSNLSCLGLLSDRVVTHLAIKNKSNQRILPYLMEKSR